MIGSVRVSGLVWGVVISAALGVFWLWLFSGSTGEYAILGSWLRWLSFVSADIFLILAACKTLLERWGRRE